VSFKLIWTQGVPDVSVRVNEVVVALNVVAEVVELVCESLV
jgi:hypothetical protein